MLCLVRPPGCAELGERPATEKHSPVKRNLPLLAACLILKIKKRLSHISSDKQLTNDKRDSDFDVILNPDATTLLNLPRDFCKPTNVKLPLVTRSSRTANALGCSC